MASAPDTRPALSLEPELYRIRDAAAVLGVSQRMIYAFIESGNLQAVRLPGTGSKRAPVRIARADLLTFVARCRQVSA
jgi:excisionase family DNA binding protein